MLSWEGLGKWESMVMEGSETIGRRESKEAYRGRL